MKAAENKPEFVTRHTSRHTSPVDGDLVDSRKAPRSSPLKAPCLHLSQIGTSIIKKLKERALKPPREAARSFNSRVFCFEIWERESAPAELLRRTPADFGRLSE